MRSPHRKPISLLMLIIFFVMNFGVYGFNSKWVAHELDHNRQTLAASTDHALQLDTKGNPNPVPLSDTEHQLLHAADHFQPLLSSANLDAFGELPAQTIPMLSRLRALPPAELEPPFRPPRFTSRI